MKLFFLAALSYFPVPLSCAVCVPAESLMFKVAVRGPVVVGVNFTVIVQSHPAFRLDLQADVAPKSPGSAPPSVTVLIASEVLWSLVTMTVAVLLESAFLGCVDSKRITRDSRGSATGGFRHVRARLPPSLISRRTQNPPAR